ncbi:TPA: hypothetical protein LC219_003802 [Salmonella enterica subsp. enterica serovar Teltow]|uniref:Uncharacterized protein n=6 Tax=Salmonella TaxID=590 RepID=S5MXA9_SALBN|nr:MULTISPECIES: hypothetical protein [Salmonella]EAA1507522.1 hypothetical protein [Salmonella enterica subsp. enterica serovar Agama]EAA5378056.1 hypothetical protein [Salmonella enterica subsp. enterica serovar Canada]EAA6031683.1 hypothetical protein [Salmonella enterica subsp. enterica serovar Kingston]EAA8812847.1 hypothetical protein [Salmonella enterica subsp. enterica]EAB7076786.1 hypothetical protein [Salmonella enterica subsp. enterica serovar Tudu]EAB8247944.1 hypothetical protein
MVITLDEHRRDTAPAGDRSNESNADNESAMVLTFTPKKSIENVDDDQAIAAILARAKALKW